MQSHLETQAAFRAALNNAELPPGITAVGDLDRRFSVYRNTVAHSLSEALGQRFPSVARIVGDAFFKAVAQIFVTAHPPRSPVLHTYGDAFPAFLASFPPAATLPYLPDVARIELLRGEAYHAADADPMPADTCAAQISADPDNAVLSLHPSLRVFVSDSYPAVSIWAMNQPGATAAPPPPDAEAALIFRRGDNAAVLKIDPDAARIVAALIGGAPLGAACQDVAPDIAALAFSTLLQHGLIIGLSQAKESGTHD
ncbi:DNA-binding domain-containing protein [Loktanella salsilacus]|uniref:HvfC/BufC N-terminal domain-containing protein n=1 Tax=Loktanella salsilacus TaxID=195913 RepID=UPI003001BD88